MPKYAKLQPHIPSKKAGRNKNNSKTNSGKNKDPEKWISPGDLCWFRSEQRVCLTTIEDENKPDWQYTVNLLRIIGDNEPLTYVRKGRNMVNGTPLHYISCLGNRYVFLGTMNDFTKLPPYKRGYSL